MEREREISSVLSPLFSEDMIKKYFGIAEGFFSNPLPMWNNKERLDAIRFISQYTPLINTYVYCPKDDPFVVNRWDGFYPQRKLRPLINAVTLCKKYGIEFCYGFNPAFELKDIQRNLDGCVEKITRKVKQLIKIDVRTFLVLYDDIPFAYNIMAGENTARDELIGKMQAEIMNAAYKRLMHKIDALLLCPSDYYFTKETPYLKALNKNLNTRIYLIWTGNDIFTKRITKTMITNARRVAGLDRNIIWWNNYPVNDCEHTLDTFHIGAFNAPENGVAEHLGGILINPMRESYANFIAYDTFTQYLRSPGLYERTMAEHRGFKKLLGAKGGPYWRLYRSFSDKNAVDDAPRGYKKAILKAEKMNDIVAIMNHIEEDLAAIKATPPVTKEGKQFIQTTKTVLQRSAGYLSLFRAIATQREWRTVFQRLDRFPVVRNKRYLTKLYNTLMNRIHYTTSCISMINGAGSRDAEKLFAGRRVAAFTKLYTKYLSKSRLTISKSDEREMLKLVNDLITLDKKRFVGLLRSCAPIQRIKRILERHLINGY